MLQRYNLTLGFALCSAVGLYLLGAEDVVRQANVQDSAGESLNEASKPQTAKSEANNSQAEEADPPQFVTETQEETTKVAFEPPFPDRTNPFQAPKRQGRASLKSKGQGESAVELLGFVNVSGPKVALSIDGLVTTAGEGETQQGIEVISIKPPAVLLQRGRQRWQATLEN